MRRPIIAGNWKMYKTRQQTCEFFSAFRPLVQNAKGAEIVICPSSVNLDAAVDAAAGSSIEIGGQNIFWAKEGAYTGEVSGAMLSSIGCKWVLIAHSERRQYFGETNESACRKLVAALEAGLKPILCVGEVLEQRQAGLTHEILATQFQGGTSQLSGEQFSQVVMAYEPVWAIGTGHVATPEIASATHTFLRAEIAEKYGQTVADACRILYGGSVKPDNCKGLMAAPNIDGALVGGASLDPASFAALVNY
jgi:triosephosphate isomerase